MMRNTRARSRIVVAGLAALALPLLGACSGHSDAGPGFSAESGAATATSGAPAPNPEQGLAATGGGAALLGILGLAAGAVLRRRRT